jgi:hypothetical protein
MSQGKLSKFVGLVGLIGALTALGCGSDPKSDDGGGAGTTGQACTPNAQIACMCGDGVSQGVATCGPTGVFGACANCPTGGGAGVGSAGVGSAGVGTSGVGTAGVGTAGVGTAGVGTAGDGTAGVGTAGVGTAGVGAAGVGGGMGCTAPETCVTAPIGGLMFCGMSGAFLPPGCTSAGMSCGPSGGTCLDGAAFGFSGMMFCIKSCTP